MSQSIEQKTPFGQFLAEPNALNINDKTIPDNNGIMVQYTPNDTHGQPDDPLTVTITQDLTTGEFRIVVCPHEFNPDRTITIGMDLQRTHYSFAN